MSSCVSRWCLACLLVFPFAGEVANFSEEELAAFSIGRAAEPIVLPVKIGDRYYSFLVDSGTSFTVVDSSLSALLEADSECRLILTPAGPKAFPSARIKAASLGKLPVCPNTPVLVQDLSSLREALGLDVYGCLGMDFLSQYVVRIDFDQGRLSLLRSASHSEGERLSLQMAGGRPWLEARVAGVDKPEQFLIDTGDIGLGSGRLRPALIRRLDELGNLRPVAVSVSETGGGRMKTKQGFLDSMKIGPFQHKGLLFGSTLDGNALGLGFLARYNVTFDFPGGALYLQANSRHAGEDQAGGSGLGFVRRRDKTVVIIVQKGSPAARAGIREGDELLFVGERNAGESCILALGRLLSGSGRTVRLVIRRGEEVHEVALTLDGNWCILPRDR